MVSTAHPGRTARIRRSSVLVAAAVALLLGAAPRALAAPAAPAAPAAGPSVAAARQLLDLTNGDRADAGLPPLVWRDDIASIAVGWSQHMADQGQLSHNDAYFSADTAAAIGSGARGENVGFSGDMAAMNYGFMNSPHHRANILDPRFTDAGFGAVQDANGAWWVTEDFLEGDAAPAAAPAPAPVEEAPAPEPAPEPAAEPVPAASAPTPTPATEPAATVPPATDPTTTAPPVPATVGVRSAANGPEVAAAAATPPPTADLPSPPFALIWFAAALLLSNVAGLVAARTRR